MEPEPGLFRMSYSKIACFQQCRKQYWFKYVSGEQWPTQRDSAASLIGTGVHRALKVLCDTDDPDLAKHELDVYTRMPIHALIAGPSEHYDTAFELLGKGIEAHKSISSEKRWGELSSWTPWPSRGITVTTQIDRADLLADGEYQLIDWKTGKWEFGEAIDFQLDIAHVVLRKARKLPATASVTTIGWNLRTGEKRVRPLNRDDGKATMRYLALVGERMMTNTDFEANPSSACAFCDWRDRCPEAADAAINDAEDAWIERDADLSEAV